MSRARIRSFFGMGCGCWPRELMDAEVTEAIGAAPYERTDKRVTSRNGVREREWDTRVGTIGLAIRKLARAAISRRCSNGASGTNGSCWRWSRKTTQGVSTRNVDAFAEALGLNGISKDQVSRICKELDGQVHVPARRSTGRWHHGSNAAPQAAVPPARAAGG